MLSVNDPYDVYQLTIFKIANFPCLLIKLPVTLASIKVAVKFFLCHRNWRGSCGNTASTTGSLCDLDVINADVTLHTTDLRSHYLDHHCTGQIVEFGFKLG